MTSTNLIASEGGFQAFRLGGGEFLWLYFSVASALLALAVGMVLMKGVLAADQGTPKMIEIALAIQEGALAYLRRQFRTIAVILVPMAVVVYLSSTAVKRPDGSVALSFAQSGGYRTLAFLAGCFLSGLTGFVGMSLAVRGNVRTAAAARTNSLPAALKVAFRTGGVAGMFTVGLGLLGATIIILLFQNTASSILVGFGFGGSLLALFLRVGGGIFTKAADVGADLVGKVEAGIPEDDPRNPATIADNVGDNVGDCAGMASDLFESYEVTLVASIILGVAAFDSIGLNFRRWASSSRSSPGPSACWPRSWACTPCGPRRRTALPWPPSTGASSPPGCSPWPAPSPWPSSTCTTSRWRGPWSSAWSWPRW